MPVKAGPDSVGFLLNDTARLIRQGFERRIVDIGLQITAGEARALLYVAANEGARQSVIAECMGVEPMTVCGYIDRLEKCGLVRRQPDPADRRAKNVHTTDAAEATIAAIRAEATVVVEHAQTALDATTRAMLTTVLKQVRGNLLAMVGERPDMERACPPKE